jgi:hypothetical protein
MEMDINGVSQLSLLVQGKSNSIPSRIGGFCLFYLILVSQTGLIKQARVRNTDDG